MNIRQVIALGNPQLVRRCYGLIGYSVCPRNRILLGIYLAVCYHIVKSKEFKLSYLELSESCTIAELTNNLEPIVYKYNITEHKNTTRSLYTYMYPLVL